MNLGRHMNKVLKVDTDDAWALMEPGVTFFDLHGYLERNGLREKIWLDVSSLLFGVEVILMGCRCRIWEVGALLGMRLSVELDILLMVQVPPQIEVRL